MNPIVRVGGRHPLAVLAPVLIGLICAVLPAPARAQGDSQPARVARFTVDLPREAVVTTKVLDLRCHVIRVMPGADLLRPGRHELQWDGTNDRGETLAAGVYMVRSEAGKDFRSLKMVELR